MRVLPRLRAAGALICCALALPAVSHSGLTYEVMAAFTPGPQNPDIGALLLHTDGNYYGVTPVGGAAGSGCVYRISPSGVFTLVQSCAEATGVAPYPGLTTDGAGNFYGVCSGGGNDGAGTLFRTGPSGGMEVLVHFSGAEAPARGGLPLGTLVIDGLGNLFGTTYRGGGLDLGTVFKFTPQGVYSALVQFTGTDGAAAGSGPVGGLTPDGNGGFWGTTSTGGAADLGTVFRISSAGALTTVHQFTGVSGAIPGSSPFGTLVRDAATGTVFGTTYKGGPSDNGTVFSVTEGGVFTGLAAFTGSAGSLPGSRPWTGLTADGAGEFYGVTSKGGSEESGTAFRINASGAAVVLTSFPAASGSPFGTLVKNPDGTFTGTTNGAGSNNLGTVFRMTPAGAVTTITRFNGNGSADQGRNPYAGLLADSQDNFYGATYNGGLNSLGSVFRCPEDGKIETLVSFTGTTGAARGARPHSALSFDRNGDLLGTTFAGGTSDAGTVFRMTPQGVLTTLIDFTGANYAARGARPVSAIVRGEGAVIIGATSGGGGDHGTLFSFSEEGGFNTLKEFSGNQGGAPGSQPFCSLSRDISGHLYGSARMGGFSGHGSVFRFRKNGSYDLLASFTGQSGNTRGSQPGGSLATDGSGAWFGTARAGGASNNGVIFRVLTTGAFTLLKEFTGISGSVPGSQPHGGLTSGGDGFYYGTTLAGGTTNLGTIFRVNAAGQFESLVNFTGAAGAFPGANPYYATLLRHTDGNIYGTTQNGGPGGAGVLFRLRFGPATITKPAQSVTQVSAVLHGEVNPHAEASSVSFEWGLSPALGNSTSTQDVPAGTAVVPVNAAISGLRPGSTYYFRVRGANASGPQRGRTLTFTTGLAADADISVFAGPGRTSPQIIHQQPGAYSFGTTYPGFDSPRILTVANGGATPLNLTALTLPLSFVLDSPAPPVSIPAGGQTTFALRLIPGAAGVAAGIAAIASNDADTPLFEFPVSGIILAGTPFGKAETSVTIIPNDCVSLIFPATAGLRYGVENSVDLTNWTILEQNQIAAGDGTVRILDSTLSTRRYYRLRFFP